MPKLTDAVPKYRKHKASGQAIVTIAGRDHYLGPWKSKASRLEYDRLIGEWVVNGRPSRAVAIAGNCDLTVAELILAYWQFAQGYYRRDGKPTGTVDAIKQALRVLRHSYGHTLAHDFGPLALAALRQSLINAGNTRTYINDHMGRIRRVFKWAAAQEMVSVSVYTALTTVAGLHHGRSEAREPEPIGPVSDEVVDSTLPCLSRVVADMVRFQRATGARPAEVCILRPRDVDRSGEGMDLRPLPPQDAAPRSQASRVHRPQRPSHLATLPAEGR